MRPPEDTVAAERAAPHDGQQCHILVVEDEYIVALDISAELQHLGFAVVGPVGSLDKAVTLAESAEPLHGAVLDVNLAGREVFPVAAALATRGIPFVFATGYDKLVLPPEYRTARQIEKPVIMSELEGALRDVCAGRCLIRPPPDA